ncbi:MAG: response regulator transcription factor [Chloroflexi bacterium]|nr:response regulator transcription factor [Chloroflexota bacterium]
MEDKPKHVVVVSQDNEGLDTLGEKLLVNGFEVAVIPDGQGARRHIDKNGLPHIMIIDLRLPDMDGLELCQDLFDVAGLPIITLSGSDTANAEEAVKALQYADDYIRTPFSTDEMVMRIRRILSRIDDFSYADSRPFEVYEGFTIDLARREVNIHNAVKKLTPTENALLHVLATHWGHVVDADTLIERVWRTSPMDSDRNALRVHMHRLRQKLEHNPDIPPVIVTERGVGYALVKPQTEV